jgi:hypothetical protein
MKLKLIAVAASAFAAGLASAPASANLVPIDTVQLQGQGIGATFTVLTLQARGASTTESGYVNFSGTPLGDAMPGQSQSRSFTFGDLGITNANQFAFVVNLAEPGSENPPSVTATTAGSFAAQANRLSLNMYSAAGLLLNTFSLASDRVLDQVAGGVGGSGLLFGLDTTQANQLNGLLATAGTEVFTAGATFANAQGGLETIQAVRLTSPVPEPQTYALMLAGIGALGFVARRRRRNT